MFTNYHKGRNFEYRCKRILESKGGLVLRSYRSLGPFDLCSIFDTEVWLVQCKRTKYGYLSKEEKRELINLAKRYKIIKVFRAYIGEDKRDKRKIPIIFEELKDEPERNTDVEERGSVSDPRKQ